jgi:hypothetical protein
MYMPFVLDQFPEAQVFATHIEKTGLNYDLNLDVLLFHALVPR